MQITDPIADLLTRVRNASTAKHPSVDVPASNLKKAIANILLEEGYVKGVQVIDDDKQGVIRITLKYTGNRRSRHLGPSPRIEAGPSHLFQLRRHAQGHEGPGHGYHLHLEGRYDRQIRTQGKCGRRSPRLCVVRKGHRQCRELEENPSSSRRALRSRSMAATSP